MRLSDRVDREGKIGGSSFTVGWLLEKLEANCEEFGRLADEHELQAVDVELISEGMGFLSSVFRCRLEFAGGRELSVCLKLPSGRKIEEILQDERQVGELARVHDRECAFYATFREVPGLRKPRVFSLQPLGDARHPSAAHLLMEFADGAANLPLDRSFTPALLRECARQMARLHAFSLQHPHLWAAGFEPMDWGKKQEGENEEAGGKEEKDPFGDMQQQINAKLEEHGGKELAEAIARLDPVAAHSNFFHFCTFQSHLQAGVCPVLVHGDLWGNNVMVRTERAADGELRFTDEIRTIIDWQLASKGSPAFDLVRLLVLNTDAEVRRECEEAVLREYFETLREAMRPAAVPFDFERLWRASRPLVLLHTLMGAFLVAFHFQSDRQRAERPHFCRRLRAAADDAAAVMREFAHEWRLDER
ncbi:CHK domain-containing protein [Aphelenchoides fujianensis]|nr:CHK domain-containing protein [Aphelenchoides fujianensis]